MRNTEVRIVEQGDVKINEVTIVVDSALAVALEINFATKGNELVLIGGDKLVFIPKQFNGEQTKITLPEFTGWKVFCSESFQHTCRLCFIKE